MAATLTVAPPARTVSRPVDVDAITARAEAAPGGTWIPFPGALWIPFRAADDDESDGHWSNSGRWIAMQEHGWHTGSPDPGPGLWGFLATARTDVLALAAEVERLRSELNDYRQEAAA